MTYRRIVRIVFFCLLLLLFVQPYIFAKEEHPYRVFLEEPLVTLEQPIVPGSFKISPNGLRYAYVAAANNKFQVILDGKKHRFYESISNLIFSSDNNHLAYIAKSEDRYFLVYDGNEGKGYEEIIDGSFSFGPDGKHYAFVGKLGEKYLVVTEAGEGKAYDRIETDFLIFSPDGQSLAYPARVGDEWFLVVNGQESKAYDQIRDLVFSEDSNRLAAVVRKENEYSVLVDDEEGPAFAMIKPESLTFSPDSQHIGYIVQDQGEEFIVIDHQIGKAYERIVSRKIAFSPDGAKTAYAVQQEENQFVVYNGVEGKPYQKIMEEPPTFSPNGRNMAYTAYNGKGWVVVLDGEEQSVFRSIGKASLTFSNRGSRLAYTAKTEDGAWTVVVDGLAGRYYNDIGLNSLTFSPDGKNVVYSARQGNKWLIVLDGEESRPFDAIINNGDNQIRFVGSAFFFYSALDGNKVVTIQERIPSKSDFVDFQKDRADIQIPLDSPAKEFTFEFNPPDGITFIETTKIVDSVEVDMMKQQLNEEEIKIRTQISKNSTGYQAKYLILQYRVNDIEDPDGGKALSVLEGVQFGLLLDSKGSIIRFEGLENFDKRLKTIPSKYYRKYKDFFDKENIEERLRNSWKFSVENFSGKSFQIGDIWDSAIKLPLPNGEISDASVMIEFKEERVVHSVPCVLLKVDYDLSSSNLKNFISELGIPQLETEPEVKVKCKGESVVDPDTMLGYGGYMEMLIKASVEIPELGEKEFIFKRRSDLSCEYFADNQE